MEGSLEGGSWVTHGVRALITRLLGGFSASTEREISGLGTLRCLLVV